MTAAIEKPPILEEPGEVAIFLEEQLDAQLRGDAYWFPIPPKSNNTNVPDFVSSSDLIIHPSLESLRGRWVLMRNRQMENFPVEKMKAATLWSVAVAWSMPEPRKILDGMGPE